ncbi:MAG: glycosyltransferase family 4 protein [Xanthomonadales bacterium]|nr:glycosyltransferase family 4 protein [Xanthomonadales bacterium]
MKRRIAIVVQRCHEQIVGGSEALAWQYATLLEPHFDVDILTTAASDYVHWRNDLPIGVEYRERIAIHRFRVATERSNYFGILWDRLRAQFARSEGRPPSERMTWPEALEEEFIRAQGPQCPDLHAHLAARADDYSVVIFLTYLYPTTFDGIRAMPHRRWMIVPCVHDEPPAYLKTIAHMARTAPDLLWNTSAEQEIGRRLWNVDHGTVVSMTVETTAVEAAREPNPYLLYCGRIDVNKGCAHLLDGFAAWKQAHPQSKLELVLTGHDVLGVGSRPGVRYLGFVDEARKFGLMAGALAFVQPSPYESLSIVLLEAMAQRVPVVVNAECEALLEHVEASGSGFSYRGQAQMLAAIDAAVALDRGARETHGSRARAYVVERYGREQVTARLLAEVEALAAG